MATYLNHRSAYVLFGFIIRSPIDLSVTELNGNAKKESMFIRSKSDTVVMRILRTAMDKAHEKVQSQDGPIEFLHARSTFYELAAILVEGGLYIVQEEMDFLEGSPNKILSDLMEIKHWLRGRIKDMKQLIIEKDRELNERLENETKLRQALEMRERELAELAPGKVKNEELATDGHISKLKNSLDQQVWNLKQKLEDEEKILITDSRKMTSHVSSPDLSFEFLNNEGGECSGFTAVDEFSKMNHLGSADQNVLIKRMSSDIDILKETLDLAFGTLQSAEVLPLEKQWRITVEKDIEYILMKGFVSDLTQRLDLEFMARVGLSLDNWVDFINEMKILCYDLKALSSTSESRDEQLRSDVNSTPPRLLRTSSEPDISGKEKVREEDREGNISHYVAKLIKNHESVIQKQSKKWNWLQSKGSSSLIKRNNDHNGHERRLQDAITRLENLITRNHVFGDKTFVSERKKLKERSGIPKSDTKTAKSWAHVKILEQEIGILKEDGDALRLQISLMEEIYQLLFQGMLKDRCFELCSNDAENLVANGNLLPPNILPVFQIKERNQHDMGFANLQDSTSIYLESSIREDVYMVYFRETVKQWNRRSRESTPRFRRWNTFSFQEGTPRSMRLIGDNSQESTPRYRKLDPDGEDSLIQKLDSLARCLEVEEDLMLKASSEIKEHSVTNNLVISNCEELEERDAIEWLLTDDESMFTSVSEKLERALKQLYTSKELLVELEESLDVSDDFEENDVEREESFSFLRQENDHQALQMAQSDMVLVQISQFQQVVRDFEHTVHVDLESKCLRLEGLKHDVDTLIQPAVSIRTRKSVYKKAFISRCHNLKLAESEVDLLADQVENLLSLLEKIYAELNKNAAVLSQYFGVFDFLQLIWTELKNGAIYTKS